MILSSAIIDKEGGIYVARQYTKMSKAKVEALYISFSRLITKGQQHTFIEVNDVRYVYQAMNELYLVLVTEKTSNILEDMKTLRLFIQAVNEYASAGKGQITEESISDNRFDLVFAFDEIVALGIRQIDNLPQLQTLIEMKSEEEKAAVEALTKKEKEAKLVAAEKSKQLDQQRRNEMLKKEGGSSSSSSTRLIISRTITSNAYSSDVDDEPIVEVISQPKKVLSRGKALKLKAKR